MGINLNFLGKQAVFPNGPKTNAQAQQIIKKRTDANVKAWKKLIADARKTVSKKSPVAKKKAAKKKGISEGTKT